MCRYYSSLLQKPDILMTRFITAVSCCSFIQSKLLLVDSVARMNISSSAHRSSAYRPALMHDFSVRFKYIVFLIGQQVKSVIICYTYVRVCHFFFVIVCHCEVVIS